MESSFDLEAFYARVGATGKERGPLRQDFVRGLKDWYIQLYGYDRYGAETAFLLGERMGVPLIFGYALLRILHDRRVSIDTKLRAAEAALDSVAYGEDMGIPHGLLIAVLFLAQHGTLSSTDLRFALIASVAAGDPLRGVDKATGAGFLRMLLDREDLPAEERALWAHTLMAQHHETAGAIDLVRALLESDRLPVPLRRELCWAWIRGRQPRLEVEVPAITAESRSRFVAEHMPFWIAHVRSWPTTAMVRAGLHALSFLGEDPLTLARTFIGETGPYAEQIHAAVADIIGQHHAAMPLTEVERLIDQGTHISSSAPARRRFYALGADLLGPHVLERAAEDSAGSVRQWAARRREKRTLPAE